MSIIAQRTVRTKKFHTCQGCGGNIGLAALAEVTVEASGGKMASYYWCSICVGFMATLHPQDLEEGFNRDMWDCDGYAEFRDTFDAK